MDRPEILTLLGELGRDLLDRGITADLYAVKGFLLGPDPFPTEVIEVPGLRCEVASPQMVLVLKCLALSRRRGR